MSIFDRRKPLKSLRRWAKKYFVEKNPFNVTNIDTTDQSLLAPKVSIPQDDSTGSDYQDTALEDMRIDEPDYSIIADQDNDTSVQCEESADEDKIRFDTGGSERFRMEANDTNGGALYIKEGSGTTAPSTPSSGEGVIYEKNDGKLYFKNDAGTEYELTATGSGSYTKWVLKGDSGSNQDITNAMIGWVKGGTGISTTVASEIAADPTRSVTIDCDLEGTELKSTGETGGSKFLREDGDGTCSWQTPSGGGSMSSFTLTGDSGSNQTVTDGNTVDIEGGTGINTVVGATDKVTVNCDLEGTELKSTGETGGNKYLREDGDGTCSWQTVTGGSGGTVQGTDHTYDIEATNDGATDGNARGENSVDLCTERSAATQVASGANSGIIAGEDNTASGTHSFIGGGDGNTASGNSAVCFGNGNTASGTRSTAIGHSNTASATYAGVFAGNNNTSSGIDSVVLGGQNNEIPTAGLVSTASGQYAKAKRPHTTACGGGDGSTFTVGEAQYGNAVWIGRTTNNSATEIFLGSSTSSRFTLDSNSAVTFEIQLVAVDEASPGTINAGAIFLGTIVNAGGTTAIGGQGSVTKTANPSTLFAAGGADADVTADNTIDSLKITVTGITGKNIRWVCSMKYTEVAI